MKTYTDDEIVRALECCLSNKCVECPCYSDLDCEDVVNIKDLLDIVKRQQAEIDELKSELIIDTNNYENTKKLYDNSISIGQKMNDKLVEAYKKLQTAKSEAIKEFAERLKEVFVTIDGTFECWEVEEHIDELVKELTEGQGGDL